MMKLILRWCLQVYLNSLLRRQRRMDAVLLAAVRETGALRALHGKSTQALVQKRSRVRTALIRLSF